MAHVHATAATTPGRMMAPMRMASPWIPDEHGEPVLDPALGRTDDPAVKAQVLGSLKDGFPFLRAAGRVLDRVDPANGEAVPLIYLTDGDWIWSGEEGYYLERYGLLPQQEFLDHMAANHYTVPPVSPEAGLEAERILRG
jgi:hypothetical protein